MNRENPTVEYRYRGLGFYGLTFLVLLTLKLLGYAPETLTWFVVFLPLIIAIGLPILILIVIAIIAVSRNRR